MDGGYLRPAKRKAEGRVAKPDGITSETRRQRQPRRHLSERTHNEVDNEAHKGIRYQNRPRLDSISVPFQSLPVIITYARSAIQELAGFTLPSTGRYSPRQCASRSNDQTRPNRTTNCCSVVSRRRHRDLYPDIARPTDHSDMPGLQASMEIDVASSRDDSLFACLYSRIIVGLRLVHGGRVGPSVIPRHPVLVHGVSAPR
jgi:hypothetical protein